MPLDERNADAQEWADLDTRPQQARDPEPDASELDAEISASSHRPAPRPAPVALPDLVRGPAREAILALAPELTASALRMSQDEHEADQLVALIISQALADPDRAGNGDGVRVWLFGLLRSAFHSVERRRISRQPRGHLAAHRHLSRAPSHPSATSAGAASATAD
jgi:hypothetical protein